MSVELKVPDLGNFADVAVIDVMVKAGDTIAVDQPLITLETDKATIDVPATTAGKVLEMLVKKGDKISAGGSILRVEADAASAPAPAANAAPAAAAAPAAPAAPQAAAAPAQAAATAKAEPSAATQNSAPHASTPARAPTPAGTSGLDEPADRRVQLLVLGAGPGGYTAAFRAADLGLSVTLVERWPVLGGVCLNVGCIPSKALLHAAKVIDEAKSMGSHGVTFGAPQIELDKLRAWKESVVKKLTGGLTMLTKQRKVEVVQGVGRFVSPHVIEVKKSDGSVTRLGFEQCIIACGSEPVKIGAFPQDPRLMDSTGALDLQDIPRRLLVIGGGIIGLEMACVYEALGSKVSVIELTPQLMPGADPDLVKPLEKRLRTRYEKILLGVKVSGIEARKEGLAVTAEGESLPGGKSTEVYDRVLLAVGRAANGRLIAADKAGVNVSDRGIIAVDKQLRTSVPHIFAIGDVVGNPMLAHKAMHEAKVAAEVAAGHKASFDVRAIPSVAYTDPEVAWVGLTELQARERGVAVEKGVFPWVASGRSLSIGRDEGFTKLLTDAVTGQIVGAGIVGPNAGELIAEMGLAIEMGADATDIALTVHPHPTLSETVGLAAEALEGTLTDLYMPKKAGAKAH